MLLLSDLSRGGGREGVENGTKHESSGHEPLVLITTYCRLISVGLPTIHLDVRASTGTDAAPSQATPAELTTPFVDNQ